MIYTPASFPGTQRETSYKWRFINVDFPYRGVAWAVFWTSFVCTVSQNNDQIIISKPKGIFEMTFSVLQVPGSENIVQTPGGGVERRH